MTKKLLLEIITRMEKEGFKIRGVVSDLGNKSFISQFGLASGNYFFENPSDPTRKVYIFADAPHLMKRARDHLMDKGYMVPDRNGKLVYWSRRDYEHLLQESTKNLLEDTNMLFKLTPDHLYCKGNMRQRVSLATQVLSHTCAKAFIQLNVKEAEAKHDACKTFNDFFDVMNSGSKFHQNELMGGLGATPEKTQQQFKALRAMEILLDKFEINGPTKAANMPWVFGMKMSIKSIRGLYTDLVKNGSFTYLLTKRVNQDCLENLFSRIRGMCGANAHPTCVEFIRRIRILLIGGYAGVLVLNPSVQLEIDERQESVTLATEELIKENNINTTSHDIGDAADRSAISTADTAEFDELTVVIDCDSYRIIDCNYQGLTYIAGYLAYKFKDKYPELGKKSSDVQLTTSLNSWMMNLSKGGLRVATEKFLLDVVLFEAELKSFHNIVKWDSIDREAYVIRRFTERLIEKFGNAYDDKIYALFSKTRTHIRISQINKKKKMLEDKARANKNQKKKKGTREYRQLGQLTN